MTLRATVTFALISFLLCTVFRYSVAEGNCSTTCIIEQCDSMEIKYGKYCGIGYWGCAGEKPCDDADACCMGHDDCVGRFGMTHVKCHTRLKNCLTRVQKSGKVGFSKECPITSAVPTMIRGMDLAILLSQLGGAIPTI
ncbi:probable phospholipase A2 homolog 1 [Vicia villosa]|uniref:probable phospholipase A2 homolog 1 n=1 Tax=Vicia villosa TaxID=3911 RepID=UPI00273CE68E|nr:probable phospholipase A2 homolog 1 [Vicia villosa]